MARITISYESEKERINILDVLRKGLKIEYIKLGKKTGKYSRCYVFVK